MEKGDHERQGVSDAPAEDVEGHPSSAGRTLHDAPSPAKGDGESEGEKRQRSKRRGRDHETQDEESAMVREERSIRESFAWETPCVAAVAGSVVHVGQVTTSVANLWRNKLRKGAKSRKEALQRGHRRKAVMAHVAQSESNVHRMLSGGRYALTEHSKREMWKEALEEHAAMRRKEEHRHVKKARHDARHRDEAEMETPKLETHIKIDQPSHATGVVLKDLIESGAVEPAKGTVALSHEGVEYVADLTSDGRIFYQDDGFLSPSDFAVFITGQSDPPMSEEEACKCIHVCGQPLEHWREHVLSRTLDTNDKRA